jgi:hypothetical protein
MKSLCWSDFTAAELEEYGCTGEKMVYLSQKFGLSPTNPKDEIVLDLYFHTLAQSMSLQLSTAQKSCFFSVVKATHQNVVSSPLVNMDKDYTKFHELLLQHSVHRPPYSEGVFSLQQAKAIASYMMNT